MKFLTQSGQIEEGEPLNDQQLAQREELITYLHKTCCRGRYHNPYEKPRDFPCEEAANYLITTYEMEAIRPIVPPWRIPSPFENSPYPQQPNNTLEIHLPEEHGEVDLTQDANKQNIDKQDIEF